MSNEMSRGVLEKVEVIEPFLNVYDDPDADALEIMARIIERQNDAGTRAIE